MIMPIIKLIRMMHSETDPRQISLGFALGMIPGFTPLTSPHNLLVLLAILIFRVNIGAALLAWGVFKILAYALDPLFHQIGLFLLARTEFLQGLWTALYNAPLLPYTRFNNTVVMGSLIFALLAFFPVYGGGKFMVVKYRETLREKFSRLKIVQVFRASSLYKWYSRYSAMRG
jgi:uncharacterized protein (TIGR03546 family)